MVIRAGEMAELLQLREMEGQMGLQGQEAVAFVREQREIGREERRVNHEEAQHNHEEAARQRESEAAARAHELEVIRLFGEAPVNPDRNNSKAPKLPSFVEGKDQIDNFIQHFERYA